MMNLTSLHLTSYESNVFDHNIAIIKLNHIQSSDKGIHKVLKVVDPILNPIYKYILFSILQSIIEQSNSKVLANIMQWFYFQTVKFTLNLSIDSNMVNQCFYSDSLLEMPKGISIFPINPVKCKVQEMLILRVT